MQLQSLAEHSDIYRDARRVAIIDLGSNSFRLIVIEYVPQLSFKIVDEVRESVRLSEGMAESAILRAAAMERAKRAMRIYAAFCKASGITDIIAVGTSAIREANNSALLLGQITAETGITVRVLSGEEEAYYAYLAAINSTTLSDGFVLDLGGGSIEVVRVQNRQLIHSLSLPLGAVRVTEGFLQSDPVSPKELRRLQKHLQEQFSAIDWFRAEAGLRLVGEGGTLRLLGRLVQKMNQYLLDDLHGYTISIEHIEAIVEQLAKSAINKRKQLPGMKSDRADISLGGAVVVLEAMRAAGITEMMICNQGLREGLFYERFLDGEQPLFEDVRRASVFNLAHLYRFQEKHAQHIAHLTLSMFDQLGPIHACGPTERELLWAAAMLHDIGVSVDYNDHHKHSAYLILNAGLPGYDHRELALIALLARYHRKGKPSADELAPLLRAGDEQRLLQLCALLRLAEQFDRSRDGVVQEITLTIGATWVQMALHTSGDSIVALWAAELHRDIFEQAFGKQLEFVAVHNGHQSPRSPHDA